MNCIRNLKINLVSNSRYLFRVYKFLNNNIKAYMLSREFKNYDEIIIKDRAAGFFSIYFQTLGALQICKTNKQNLVLSYDLAPYYDKDKNPSEWWSNYFINNKFIFNSKKENYKTIVISDINKLTQITYVGTELTRIAANKLICKNLLSPYICRLRDEFYNSYMIGKKLIGVHYRGTDKVMGPGRELERVPYEYVFKLPDQCSREKFFFIATDEEEFIQAAIMRYPGRVIFTNAQRSSDAHSVHFSKNTISPFNLGLQAILDALLLSRCDFLYRCDSNLSLASLFFNYKLKSINMTEQYLKRI